MGVSVREVRSYVYMYGPQGREAITCWWLSDDLHRICCVLMGECVNEQERARGGREKKKGG